MVPINFNEQTTVLTGDGGDIGDLPAYYDGEQVVSCWRLDPDELATVAETGVIWLNIMGQYHPPISMQVEHPWSQNVDQSEDPHD